MNTVDSHNTLSWRHRRPGKQVLWERPLVQVFGSDWMKLALARGWSDRKSKWVDGAYASLKLQPLEQRYAKQAKTKAEPIPFEKKPRNVEWEPQSWTVDMTLCRLEVCGDSKVIVNWLNGVWPTRFLPYFHRVSRMHRQLHQMVKEYAVRPLEDSADFCRHVFRELNDQADALTNRHLPS